MTRLLLIQVIAGFWIGLLTSDLSLLMTILIAAGVAVCIDLAWSEGRRPS